MISGLCVFVSISITNLSWWFWSDWFWYQRKKNLFMTKYFMIEEIGNKKSQTFRVRSEIVLQSKGLYIFCIACFLNLKWSNICIQYFFWTMDHRTISILILIYWFPNSIVILRNRVLLHFSTAYELRVLFWSLFNTMKFFYDLELKWFRRIFWRPFP